MQEHGVPESQRVILNGFTDPALAIEAAKALGAAEALKTETKTAKLAEVPNGSESGSYDSTAGAVGTETDAQWLEKYNSGDPRYDSPADDAKAIKILAGRGIDMTRFT